MQIQERRCLTSMRVCLCMCGGRRLAAQAERHANGEPDAQLSTSKNKTKQKKQKGREAELSGQGRRWAELIPEEMRILGENFITVTFPSAARTWTQQEGRLFVLPSHLEYNYRLQLWGGAVEVDGANPRVEDVVSNRFIRNQNIWPQQSFLCIISSLPFSKPLWLCPLSNNLSGLHWNQLEIHLLLLLWICY